MHKPGGRNLVGSQARREGKESSCRGDVAMGVRGRGTIKVNGNNVTKPFADHDKGASLRELSLRF